MALKFTAKLVFGSDQGTGVDEVFILAPGHGFRVPSRYVTGYDFSHTVMHTKDRFLAPQAFAQRSGATKKNSAISTKIPSRKALLAQRMNIRTVPHI